MKRHRGVRESEAEIGKVGCRAPKRPRCWAEVVAELALRNGVETDQHKIDQRQKQIDYGKNTLGYDRYSASVRR